MNTKLFIITGIIVALSLFGFIYWKTTSSTSSPSAQKAALPSPETIIDVTQSRYIPYSKSAFDIVSDKKRVLYFHANWCPVCRPIHQEFTEKSDQIPDDIVVFRVDYDTETDLKKKYIITYQHTFVQVDNQGNEIQQWDGGGLTELIRRVQ